MYKIFALVFLFIIQFSTILSASTDIKKVSLQLSWLNQFQFAGYYMAKEKGFYNQLGLEVDIKPFVFGIDIPKDVNEGKTDFAIGRENLILQKAKNKNIVALFTLFQSSPLVLLTTKDSGIDSIKKFTNKTIMTTKLDAGEISLNSMITSQGVNISKLKFLKHTHNIQDLIDKKTDIISAYLSKAPYLLKKQNITYNLFNPKDYGFDMYSDILYTNNSLIDTDTQTVLKFKEASLQGWRYAFEHIEESVDLILKKYNTQNLTKEELIFEANELKKLSLTNSAELGEIKLDKIQRIYDLYNILGLIPNKIDINEFVFNETQLYRKLTKKEKQFLKTHPIVNIGEQELFRPINFLNNIGLHDGVLHDYLHIISEKTGIRFISESDTYDNLFTKLKNNKLDLVAIAINQNKENFLLTPPYFELKHEAFKLKDNSYHTVTTIGVLNLFFNKNEFLTVTKAYPKAKIITAYSLEEAVNNLLTNRVDVLYISEELLLSYIQDHHITKLEYAHTRLPQLQVPLSFAFNKENKILHSIFTKVLNLIPYSQHESIRNKWVPVMIDNEFDWTLIWQIILFLVVIIILIIYKQISMNNMNKKLQVANNKLKELSEKDSLTKLYNRRYFEDIIEQVLKIDNASKNTTSLVMFDIDDFKKINDTYGHHMGDEVLITLAKHLKQFNRKSDIIARIGGEEFLILLPNTAIEGAKIHCENLRKKIEDIEIVDEEKNQTIKFTVSMGLTSFKDDDTLDSVLLRVDDGLYTVKRTGKNRLFVN